MKVHLEFKLEDVWLGVYWRRRPHWTRNEWTDGWDVWVCLIPCLPIHIEV